MQTKQDIIQWLEDNQGQFTAMSDDIWANPELGWEEYFASARQADFLHEKGFNVYSIADIPTAFIAEWGEGAPVIGFVGEYDALPGLSQKVQTTKEAIEDGAPGHGCGHNMLGTAGVASAVAIKEWLEATGRSGKVRYYGCPAEENGDPKAHMALAGAYDDMDVAFNFHPSTITMAGKGSSIGVYDAYFRFHGRTSHAGGSPHLGRSALDAVELMNVGVNYLREHVLPSVRMHYTITKGGEAPNIVPDLAEVWYFLRAHQPDEMKELVERVRKIADGAAMMTETRVEEIFASTVASMLSNHTLSDLQHAAMQVVGELQFTEAEVTFAQQINDEYIPAMLEDSVKYMTGKLRIPEDEARLPLLIKNYAATNAAEVMGGSTDVGDLSWNVPVSMLGTTCWPSAAPGHSWGNTSTGGMSIGHKGMMHAAKIMAVAAMDCYTDPVHIQKAREEFEQSTKTRPYISMIPDGVTKPPIEFNPPEDNLTVRYPQCPFYNPGKRG
jgi:aminobenzoyl-glutamate utilization protein B